MLVSRMEGAKFPSCYEFSTEAATQAAEEVVEPDATA